MRVTGDGGVGIEVWVDGPDDGEPVLLLHGWPDSHDLWRHQVGALTAAGLRTVAPDLRGFGASDKPTDVEAYGLAHSVADMLAVLDAVGAERARVVGHDWGAALAWGLAAFVPDRVDRLAVLSVGHPTAFANAGYEQRMRSWYMLLFQFEGIAEQWLQGEGALMLASHPQAEEVRRRLAEPGALTASLGWYRANAHPRNLVTGPRQLPPVTRPVLGVWSSNDIALTEKQMVDSAQYVDAPWRYERLDGPGHWMQAEAPDRVNELLLEFLPD
ncbi:MAG TPA: alpha/beta fold hydrolase [Mycobacteriales bacterium]|nr:alpha/beta fold hydrolase [Mycobacteriales bacterium]